MPISPARSLFFFPCGLRENFSFRTQRQMRNSCTICESGAAMINNNLHYTANDWNVTSQVSSALHSKSISFSINVAHECSHSRYNRYRQLLCVFLLPASLWKYSLLLLYHTSALILAHLALFNSHFKTVSLYKGLSTICWQFVFYYYLFSWKLQGVEFRLDSQLMLWGIA